MPNATAHSSSSEIKLSDIETIAPCSRMETNSRSMVLGIFLFIGFFGVSYYFWSVVHLQYLPLIPPISFPQRHVFKRGPAENFLILDYTGYIDDVKEDYLVGNCIITQNKSHIGAAHAVVITSRRLKSREALPRIRYRWQKWVWLLDESPYHSSSGQPFTMRQFDNVYNWTMTYRSDSDVYIPYGKTIRATGSDRLPENIADRPILVMAVISNCNSAYVHNDRFRYVQDLNKTVSVILFGKCGRPCEGYSGTTQERPCPEIKKSLFYLAFENSNCREYVTEKFFGNGLESGAVPVVMGAAKAEYTRIAPPKSFIHVRDFASPKLLGEYLKYLSWNRTAYMEYHAWRKEFSVKARYQFISRSIWKPLCEKLNSNKGNESIVPSLNQFWSLKDCDSKKWR